MLRLALKMLYGDVAKFVMLLGGLTFCALLQIIYRFDRPAIAGIYVGQQMDVFLDAGK
jgi:hypothetical protein